MIRLTIWTSLVSLNIQQKGPIASAAKIVTISAYDIVVKCMPPSLIDVKLIELLGRIDDPISSECKYVQRLSKLFTGVEYNWKWEVRRYSL